MHRQLGLDFYNSESGETARQFDRFMPCAHDFAAPRSEMLPDEAGAFHSTLAEVLQIHEYERRRLGHELHDSTGQLLIVLELSIAHLKEVEIDHSHDGLLAEIQETVRQIDQEIRTLAFLDYPAEVSDNGLCPALCSLARGLQKRTGLQINVRVVGDMSKLSDQISLALLRVAQEALTNVHRHAHASAARIILRKHAKSFELTISDNGIGMRQGLEGTRAVGIGLKGIRHRAESMGGSLKIKNLVRGTCISVSVPLAA
jgi:two-component system NarL family sensor kinase